MLRSSVAAIGSKHRFFVWCPDKTDEGALQRRLSVRESHLAGFKEKFASGLVRIGGMVTTPETLTAPPDTPKHMIGSTFIAEADSIDTVWNAVKSDIYYTAGVWDPAKIVVLPWFGALPEDKPAN